MTDLLVDSLADQIAARARQRQARREQVLTIPIPGYEDLFAAQYKILGFEEKAPLIRQYEDAMMDADRRAGEAVLAAADVLIKANTDLLAVDGENEDGSRKYRSLGTRWSTDFIAKHWQKDFPEGLPVHAALADAIDHEDLSAHFGMYIARTKLVMDGVVEEMPGESRPSEEG